MSDHNAENEESGNFVKQALIWGIPVAILLVLMVLLVLELRGGREGAEVKPDDIARQEELAPPEPEAEEEAGETGASESEEDSAIAEEEPPPAEEEEDEEEAIAAGKVEGGEEEDSNASYIDIRKGENLWMVAGRKKTFSNPFHWKTILVQNKDKIDYTIVSEDSGNWKVILHAGRRLKIKPVEKESSKNLFGSKKKKYALQLMSLEVEKLDTAISIVKFLIKDGYYAYLYRTKTKIQPKNQSKPSHFYRIRTGFFATQSEAMKTGKEIYERYRAKSVFPKEYWAVLPSYSELSGELIDFGIQRSKPWIIQLSERTKRSEAIADFKKIIPITEFTYVSQKKTKAGYYKFRTKVGFFEDRKTAERVLDRIQRTFASGFPKAKVIEIKNLMESAPGQNTGVTTKKEIEAKAADAED